MLLGSQGARRYAKLADRTSHRTEFQDTEVAFVPNHLPIPGDSEDARAVRTRSAVAGALYALMRERGYDAISVQDICERADIGRSTFYAHFQDKDDIFIRHTVAAARMFGEQLMWDPARGYRFPVHGFLEHVLQMQPVFDSFARVHKREFLFKICQNNMAGVFEARIRTARAGVAASIPAVILAQQLAGTLMTLLMWWLDHHQPIDAAQMEEQWGRLVAGLR